MSKNILREILKFFPEHIKPICSCLKNHEGLSREDKASIDKIISYLKRNPLGRPPKVPGHLESMLRESVG